MRVLGTLVAIVALLSPGSILASPGDPDPSFGGGDGKVTYAYLAQDDVTHALAQQKDGKIVAAGTTTSGAIRSIAVLRLKTDGSLDPTFGVGGKAVYPVLSGTRTVAIQDDGKILVAGYLAGDMALVRLTTGGSIDQGFGVGGVVTTDFGGFDRGYDVVIQANGRIVVAGDQYEGDNILLARYLPNGDPDPSFGPGGKAIQKVAAAEVTVRALTVLPDGKIAVAGWALDDAGDGSVLTALFNANGTPDLGFGPNGVRIYQLGTGDSYGMDVLAYPPDKTLVVCQAQAGSTQRHFALLLLGPTGLIEGSEITDLGVDSRATAGAIRADGKILVAGAKGSSFGVYQYTSSLALDPSFSGDGVATIDLGAGIDQAEAVLVQSDGKIVLAGSAPQTPPLSAPDFAFARLQGVGTPVLADDFGNGVMTWSQVSGTWSESNGYLSASSATTAKVNAPTPWIPSGAPGCSHCTILTTLTFLANDSLAKLTVSAWYSSATNQVQLLYSPRTGKWTLKQQANGASIRRRIKWPITSFFGHDIGLSYTGTHILFGVDGKLLVRMPAIAAPAGNVGYRIKHGVLSVRDVAVY
jgi:uncharacterized delta-60 repeat protein